MGGDPLRMEEGYVYIQVRHEWLGMIKYRKEHLS